MVTLLRWSILVVGLVVVGGTLLSFSRHPHWFIRGWDFPRVHIATLAAVSGGSYAAFFCDWRWYEWLFVLTMVCCVVWQGYKIFPYTPFAPVQVKRARAPAGAASFRLLIANVLMQNRQFDRFLRMAQAADRTLSWRSKSTTGGSRHSSRTPRLRRLLRAPTSGIIGDCPR